MDVKPNTNGVKIMVSKDLTRVGFKFDNETIDKIEKIRVYLEKKYGIESTTGAIKYIVRKSAELVDENKL